jgi:hypothetical protein
MLISSMSKSETIFYRGDYALFLSRTVDGTESRRSAARASLTAGAQALALCRRSSHAAARR